MADRRPIQQAHERAYVQHFLNWFNHAYNSDFQVINEPKTPDAVIRSSKTTRWIEISTAFWNETYAKDLYSSATPGEEHKPIGSGPFQNMDICFAQHFVSVVKKKLEKPVYVTCLKEYGPGYLVVPIKHPWFDKQTINLMKDEWDKHSINNLGCFRSAYIAFHSLNEIKFFRWPIK